MLIEKVGWLNLVKGNVLTLIGPKSKSELERGVPYCHEFSGLYPVRNW